MLLNRQRSQLLVVDVQERLLPAMLDGERLIERCAVLIQAAQRLAVPTTISEQYAKGLGPTVAPLREAKGGAPIMEKMHFSCAADSSINARVRTLASGGRSQLVICGIESHVCVLQTALGFADEGLSVFVAIDAVSSRRHESIAAARARLAAADITIGTTEMVVFEWLHIAGTPEFKELSRLIK